MAELTASILGIISFGTSTSIGLFKIASELGAAGENVEWLAAEISVFCAVLNDLKATLEKARSSGFSLESLKSMQTILDHCKLILERIQAVIDKVTTLAEDGSRSITALGRGKWLLSKSKVENLRTRLESSKVTLSVMMTGFNWAQLLESKRSNSGSKAGDVEAEVKEKLFQSLLLTQQSSVGRLERIEAEQGLDIGVALSTDDEIQGAEGHFASDPWPLPEGGLSTVLNTAIFYDGLKASERQWVASSLQPGLRNTSGGGSSAFLNRFAQRLTSNDDSGSSQYLRSVPLGLGSQSHSGGHLTLHATPYDETGAQRHQYIEGELRYQSRVKSPEQGEEKNEKQDHKQGKQTVTVTFIPSPLHYRSRFNEEPTYPSNVTIPIFASDEAHTIIRRVLDTLRISYQTSYYDLYLHYGDVEKNVALLPRPFEEVVEHLKMGRNPVFTIQNNLDQERPATLNPEIEDL